MKISRRSDVTSFIVMDIMEAARRAESAGRHIIHMEVGQPSTPAPAAARAAVAHALDRDALGYTVALGLPDLRAGIARLYHDWYEVTLNPDRVIITTGSSAGFLLAFSALFDAGDAVGIAAPGYPSYRQILKALSLRAVDIETDAAHGFQPTVADIAGVQVSGMLVASPANPTGTMLPRAALQALIDHAAGRGMTFISDEISMAYTMAHVP